MKNSLPLHLCHVQNLSIFINRSHTLLHSIAIAFLIYYRASFLLQETRTRPTHMLARLIVFGSELLLSFIWFLGAAYYWRPVSRTVFPERLTEDDKLPAIDVFICTTDPNKEPTIGVMNTVLSAMALDYPAEKLHVYLSDDGGAAITLHGLREAWRFAKWWLPFCKKYDIKTRCPQAYFSTPEEDGEDSRSFEFMEERERIKEKYEGFKERVLRTREEREIGDTKISTGRDHPTIIEVIQDNSKETVQEDQVQLPLLVYVSREKRPTHPHHFKAGALNVLLRVSGLISNSPYILGLDCDMYCNDPTSARQAMCFYLDPKISPSLSFVQFHQKFHNISKNDIYAGQLRSYFGVLCQGMDGLKGPVLSGTCYYIKRDSLYGNSIEKGIELVELKSSFGPSNEFINALRQNYKINITAGASLQETQFVSSCTYEIHTKWGEEESVYTSTQRKQNLYFLTILLISHYIYLSLNLFQVGFLYESVTEDVFTGYILHCKGWTSVYLNPARPQFYGTSTISLNDLLIQGTRWSSGLVEVGFSKYYPLIYGTLRMSSLQSICYGELVFFPLLYCFPLWCFATIPQLCLLNGIPLYPEVSSTFFSIYLFIFLSALFKQLLEIFITGGSIQTWKNEQRIWMMKSVTSHAYGSLDAIMKRLGMREASFLPTNKVVDDEKDKLYQMGKFDFQTSTMFLVPLVTLVILSMASLVGGVIRMVIVGNWDEMFVQVCLLFYILFMNYAIVEGMIIRKDKGHIPLSVTLSSAIFSMVFLFLGSIILNY